MLAKFQVFSARRNVIQFLLTSRVQKYISSEIKKSECDSSCTKELAIRNQNDGLVAPQLTKEIISGVVEIPKKDLEECGNTNKCLRTMDALVLSTKDNDVIFQKIPVPSKIRRNEVCIKVQYAAVNLTDLSIIRGKIGNRNDGVVLGTNLSGLVCGAGDEVRHVRPGDTVVVAPCQPENLCKFCHEEKCEFCIKEKFGGTFGAVRNGGWTSFTTAPANMVYKVDGQIGLEKCALLPMLAQVICALSKLNIEQHRKILIQGSGLSGIFFALLLQHHGYTDVKIWEDNPNRVSILKELGVTYPTIEAKDVSDIDLVISSGVGISAMQQAYEALNTYGQLLAFGQIGHEDDLKINVRPSDLSLKSVVLRGINGTPSNPGNVPVELAKKILDLEKLGVPIYPLEEFCTALTRVNIGDCNAAIFLVNKQSPSC